MNGQDRPKPRPPDNPPEPIERDYPTEEDERELRPRNPLPAEPGTPEVNPPLEI